MIITDNWNLDDRMTVFFQIIDQSENITSSYIDIINKRQNYTPSIGLCTYGIVCKF